MSESGSKVSNRLAWLEGQRVYVRMSYADTGQVTTSAFEATYLDTLPMGRSYFFVLSVDGARHVVRTENVVSMMELGR